MNCRECWNTKDNSIDVKSLKISKSVPLKQSMNLGLTSRSAKFRIDLGFTHWGLSNLISFRTRPQRRHQHKRLSQVHLLFPLNHNLFKFGSSANKSSWVSRLFSFRCIARSFVFNAKFGVQFKPFEKAVNWISESDIPENIYSGISWISLCCILSFSRTGNRSADTLGKDDSLVWPSDRLSKKSGEKYILNSIQAEVLQP